MRLHTNANIHTSTLFSINAATSASRPMSADISARVNGSCEGCVFLERTISYCIHTLMLHTHTHTHTHTHMHIHIHMYTQRG